MFSDLGTKTKISEINVQSIKIQHPRNIIFLSQKKSAELVLLINFTRICSISVLSDRLNILILIRFYSSAVSQDLSDRIPKYKILFQQKNIRLYNIATLLRILCFLDRVDIPEIIFSRANLFYKFWNITGEIEEVILFETEFYIDLLVDTTETNNTIYFLVSYALIIKTDNSFQKRDFSVDKMLQLYIMQSASNPDK